MLEKFRNENVPDKNLKEYHKVYNQEYRNKQKLKIIITIIKKTCWTKTKFKCCCEYGWGKYETETKSIHTVGVWCVLP